MNLKAMDFFTWAYAIIVGFFLIIPKGIVLINTNPAVATILGAAGIGLGLYGFYKQYRASRIAN
ncbi:MAG TPA: hypothetical protein ENJ95_00870 [Bacteroidetes bacterium]|nr:hypothetical protein [Bacteroidota bacterium]